MLDQLLLNTRVHLKFFARNRLVLGLGLIVVVVSGLGLVPGLFMASRMGRLDVLRTLVSQLGWATLLFTSALGLFAVSAHVRGRSVKMVLTKSCSPEAWLGSIFLAGCIVIAGLHLVLGIGTWMLSLALGVPYQSAFAFVIIDGFFRAAVWFSYVTVLAVALHPVLAVLLAVFVNEGTFYGLKLVLASADRSGHSSWLLSLAGRLTDVLYFALPMTEPFADKTSDVYASLRTVSADWPVLFQVGGYAVLATLFAYCLSAVLLRRKSLA